MLSLAASFRAGAYTANDNALREKAVWYHEITMVSEKLIVGFKFSALCLQRDVCETRVTHHCDQELLYTLAVTSDGFRRPQVKAGPAAIQ